MQAYNNAGQLLMGSMLTDCATLGHAMEPSIMFDSACAVWVPTAVQSMPAVPGSTVGATAKL